MGNRKILGQIPYKITVGKKRVQLLLNNAGLNYLDPVIREYFSVVNSAERLGL